MWLSTGYEASKVSYTWDINDEVSYFTEISSAYTANILVAHERKSS